MPSDLVDDNSNCMHSHILKCFKSYPQSPDCEYYLIQHDIPYEIYHASRGNARLVLELKLVAEMKFEIFPYIHCKRSRKAQTSHV